MLHFNQYLPKAFLSPVIYKIIIKTNLLLLLISIGILFSTTFVACRNDNTDKWIKNDTTFANFEDALEKAKTCKVLILRNDMPSGKRLSTSKTIDERIHKLEKLEKLSIYGLLQNEIPKQICQLKHLKILEIYIYNAKNVSIKFPSDLSQLTQLKQLTLIGFGLEEIPILPPSLEILNLNKNKIKNIETIVFKQNIRTIDLSFNNITSIDISQPNYNLKQLNISHNSIFQLPKNLSFLQKLELFSISNNPINNADANFFAPMANRVEAIGIEQKFVEILISEQTKHLWLSSFNDAHEVDFARKYPQIKFIWFGKPNQ